MITPSLLQNWNICKTTQNTVKWQVILSVFLWLYGTFRCLWFDFNFSASSLTPLQSIDLQKRSLYQFSQNGQIILNKTVPELHIDTHTIIFLFAFLQAHSADLWGEMIWSLDFFSQPTLTYLRYVICSTNSVWFSSTVQQEEQNNVSLCTAQRWYVITM